MSGSKSWFEVDKDGLRTLQDGKDKSFVLRELVQNAWDEDIHKCEVKMEVGELGKRVRTLVITVEDDGAGFRELKDAYTLFANTYKRPDATKRGRFNLGEKQAFSVALWAVVETTTGTVKFTENGRINRPSERREKGPRVAVAIKATDAEIEEIKHFATLLIPPKDVVFTVGFWNLGGFGKLGGMEFPTRTPFKVFDVILPTELMTNGRMTTTQRMTQVAVYHKDTDGKAHLYEAGIPVCEIECDYSINVNQRIPLSVDRDKVSAAYLKHLLAEVLNETYESITKENASAGWVRIAASDSRVVPEAVKQVVQQRFGEKACVASPNDMISVDDAISNGYNVVHGSEMSAEEWENIRKANALQSSHALFGKGEATDVEEIPESEISQDARIVAELAKRVAKVGLGIDIAVRFIESGQVSSAASFCPLPKTLTFNTSQLNARWFRHDNREEQLRLIIHEVGHDEGMHTEQAYHEAICKIGAMLALTDGWRD
jgi:hypothetical protein